MHHLSQYATHQIKALLTQINNLQFRPGHLPNMSIRTAPPTISINHLPRNRMWMKQTLLLAVSDRFHPWWIRQPKYSPAIMSHGRQEIYLGCFDGEHTIAIASGSMIWYPTWVCKSTLLMKHVCVGWVWIHPKVNREWVSWKSKTEASSVVLQESDVDVWGGMRRVPIMKALLRYS
jgi:hypothetical protein